MPITQARLKELLLYHPETGEFTWKVKPCRRIVIGTVAGSNHGEGYIEVGLEGVHYLVHRLVWLYAYGEFPTFWIDHADRDKANNRIGNLRRNHDSLNHFNSKLPCHNTSGYKGVSLNKVTGKFLAILQFKGKRHWLGYHPTAIDASKAYEAALHSLHPQLGVKDDNSPQSGDGARPAIPANLL